MWGVGIGGYDVSNKNLVKVIHVGHGQQSLLFHRRGQFVCMELVPTVKWQGPVRAHV